MIEERTPNKHNLVLLLGYIVMLGSGIYAVVFIKDNTKSIADFFGLSIIVIIFTFWLMLLWFKNRQRNFRCPGCKNHIPRSQSVGKRSGSPIYHYCGNCKINWLLGKVPSNTGDGVGGV